MSTYSFRHGDARDQLRELASKSIQCCVTSPPYWGLRDYGIDGQIGLERTPDAYVAEMVAVFSEVRRVLTDDAVLFLNLGDSYMSSGGCTTQHGPNARCRNTLAGVTPRTGGPREAQAGLKTKDLIGVPWMVAFALRSDGWYLRSDIIWAKPNPMPESVTDRPTKSHEYIFLLTKRAKYFYDAKAIEEPIASSQIGRVRADVVGGTHREGLRHSQGAVYKQDGHSRRHAGFNERWDRSDGDERATRNCRSVWEIATQPYPEAHFATFPEAIPERCIKAGSREGDTVLDPFCGSGTTGAVAVRLNRDFIGIDLNADYLTLARNRIDAVAPLFVQETPAPAAAPVAPTRR